MRGRVLGTLARREHPDPHPRARHSHPFRLLAAAGTAAAVLLTAGACGSDDDGDGPTPASTGGGSAPAELTTVKVGVIPIIDVAPLYLGIEQGFFEEEGLKLEVESGQGGAALIPGVVSGEFQFGFSNTVSLLLARSNNLPVRAVAPGNSSTGDPAADFGAVVVPEGSDIQSAADLAGKRVAINTLRNINELTVRHTVAQAGGDPSTIEFVELPFPEIPAAVASGDVDAGQVVEPFLTIAKNQGMREVAANLASTENTMMVAMYFASEQYIEDNPEIVEAFTRAMTRSLEYASENPDAARDIMSTYLELDPEVQANVTLPGWPSEINKASVEEFAEMGVTYGLWAEAPDVARLLP